MISVAYVGAISATVLLSSIIIASSTDFATCLLGSAHLSSHLQAGTLLLVINGINGVQLGALAGFEAFRALAVVNLWAGVLSFPLVILGANLAGSYGAVWGVIATAGVNCALCHRALAHVMSKNGVRAGFSGCRTEISKLWSFSLPSFITMSLAGPVMWLGNAMLVHESGGYSEMGIFNAANQWGAVILFIPYTLSQPTLAILSNHGGSGDKEGFRNCLLHSIVLTSVSCLTVGLIVAITGTLIMRAYGMGFSAGVPVLLTSVGAAVLAAPQIPILHAMTATGRVWQNVAIHLAWAATFLIVASMTHGFGAKGLALNYVIAYLVQGVVYAFVFPSVIRLRE
jgi:O-antigen/teichoic acid export membrane protein